MSCCRPPGSVPSNLANDRFSIRALIGTVPRSFSTQSGRSFAGEMGHLFSTRSGGPKRPFCIGPALDLMRDQLPRRIWPQPSVYPVFMLVGLMASDTSALRRPTCSVDYQEAIPSRSRRGGFRWAVHHGLRHRRTAAYQSTWPFALLLAFIPRSHLAAAILACLIWAVGYVILAVTPNYPADSTRIMGWGINQLVALLLLALGPRVLRRYIGWRGWKKR